MSKLRPAGGCCGLTGVNNWSLGELRVHAFPLCQASNCTSWKAQFKSLLGRLLWFPFPENDDLHLLYTPVILSSVKLMVLMLCALNYGILCVSWFTSLIPVSWEAANGPSSTRRYWQLSPDFYNIFGKHTLILGCVSLWLIHGRRVGFGSNWSTCPGVVFF